MLTLEEHQRLVGEGYAPALAGVEPAVVAYTTQVAAAAVGELIERLVHYGPEPAPTELLPQIMLGKLDPATVKLFRAVQTRARQFAEDQLKRGMFRNGGNWSQAAAELIDTRRWQSHSQMISWADAQDPRIGLVIEYLDPTIDGPA